ncbi:PEP/pyruvate-binding domain-containing protein [Pseudodesulfovibrio piezophilus]|uniref:Phosphoenolpyruvate synthase n=1 Tax=Pseudodesulfovibrio piezophilus (strain DSM 21447 / JCM 15486 / C1TLV30) TaxID=1322246 RepID=M1WUN7_PSEP2|nr:PEP/pyruvate-binding domain-containing protein [Pseudodesulfovibrio piezophilus]CCH47658.1 Pyruvate phosphate dikinase PEP/pyruvate-binding [Pseudodesulfovibrio piezophilus C1TLV30]
MAKTQKKPVQKGANNATLKAEAKAESLKEKLVLNGAEIELIGEDAELLVGGKNYNTAIISQIQGIRAPEFRAISSHVFHTILDDTKVNAAVVRATVDKEYNKIDWNSDEVNEDSEFLQHFVREVGKKIREQADKQSGTSIKLRTFVNNVVEGFATSPEGIDQLRMRSVLVQSAILSVELPVEIQKEVKEAYLSICSEAGMDDVPVAVRSSAAGEDSRKKAFAGLQDTYLNIVGPETCLEAYHWDCASAYNLRSMTYRREAILDAITKAEETGDDSIAENAKKEWAIEHTSLSVCIMRMINPVISGTAFSADTATGCRGTDRNDLVSIDTSYGLGEAVVGGMVTPDKFYVFQRDGGHEVVIRYMGCKEKKIVYKEDGSGTHVVKVPENEVARWALSIAQAEMVAQGVRAISKAYGGMIMDTEFCIDKTDRLWFVQARPETRWNEDYELHPDTIFMRRLEVDKKAVDSAEVILEGNGASRGAGQGTVRYLRSALELNKVNKGDILAAERTDPDMVPGMRIASAILADVGGDTSHAAITSRELGIPAIIGIQRLEALRSLDGQQVTVDGSRGKVYRGELPLVEVGGEINVANLPATQTKVGLILADVGQSLFLSRLRNVPDFEVGLLRAEFMLGNIGVHPMALEAYDKDDLNDLVDQKLMEMDKRLTKVMKEQLADGLIRMPLKLREYVGLITGLSKEMDSLAEQEGSRSTDGVLAMHRKLREMDHKLDDHITHATERLDVLKTSIDLDAHIAVILGFHDMLEPMPEPRTEYWKARQEHEQIVANYVKKLKDEPEVVAYLDEVTALREEVALKMGLKSEMDEVATLPDRIRGILEARGYTTGKENYIQTLSQGLALFAMAFYGSNIVYRTTDFKSNEYRNLLGGSLFEAYEDNPMIGYRGVSRNIHDWELEAFKLARGIYGGKNLSIMFPFVRTLEEARSMKRYLRQVHNLESGKDDLKIILMAEIPSNAILCKEFLEEVDGFSIGSNDMTQMVLATDRDNASLQHIYDEEDPAVVWAILCAIFAGQKVGKKVGFCGQGVSNSVILRGLVTIAGIVSASVVPDTYHQTKIDMAAIEAENIKTRDLGAWLKKQHMNKLCELLENNSYGHILKKYKSPEDFMEWYEGELDRFSEQLREHMETPKEEFYRQEMEQFRGTFHKPVIYASWNWDNTVADAMKHAGFDSFDEQEAALEVQRSKLW